MVAFPSDALSRLCSKDQLVLLDSIDQLRLHGINNYISLPSVLEAISGVSFPVKSNFVSIVPHDSRPEPERKALLAFRQELEDFADLGQLVERAKTKMGITAYSRAFAKDILRIEVTGLDRPHLTIVDLPGLIHSETKSQTTSDVDLIQDVVQSYMREPRWIILAVVSAKNDFANQVVLKLARAADPSGTRTLGVITKPDTLVPGGGSESMYVSLARNQEVEFRHGWYVVRNMDSEKGASNLLTRDAEEATFFSSGVWTALPHSSLGIDKLRGRLSKVLLGQIASELPGLMEEINQKFGSCRDQLEKLGEPRASPEDQRRYLVHLSQSFQMLVKTSVGGNYNNPFFSDAKTELGYQQRIRAVVQNLNESFASNMSLRGHYHQITDLEVAEPVSASSCDVVRITRDDFISMIEKLIGKTRGYLFLKQRRPWGEIARLHVDEVWNAASRFVKLVVAHTADASAAKALQLEVFEPAMKEVLKAMRDKTTVLLSPNQNSHPITYNHDFAETLRKVRSERRLKEPERLLRQFLGVNSLEPNNHLAACYDLKGLADALAKSASSEPDMKRSAAGEALDCLNAYYKVALKRFIDDMAVQVIEAELMRALDVILSPISIFEMPADQVTRVAGESEETRTERDQLNKQIEVLRSGLETCKRFVGFRISGGRSVDDSLTTQTDRHGSVENYPHGFGRSPDSESESEETKLEPMPELEPEEPDLELELEPEPEPEPEPETKPLLKKKKKKKKSSSSLWGIAEPPSASPPPTSSWGASI
ncbi:interferon-induced GTP-binding protein Mx [Chaetomidium leptoderma]|uniref:Interferon-induced GTP-binding protein Mx n=1 Tax=Chaetomidium leptoderma TaxID=669021 RepID=A0AAN6VH61_9PEZI|nr:interferon-induced GTP-binding protein Mx [Chaetomidium leptoderma]